MEEGDIVFSIPVNAVINVEHAFSDPILGEAHTSLHVENDVMSHLNLIWNDPLHLMLCGIHIVCGDLNAWTYALGDLFSSPSADELTELEIMGGYLVHEKFKRADSRWQQYLDFIPISFPTNPVFFDDITTEDFADLLVGQLIVQKRSEVARSYKRVKKLVQRSPYFAKKRLTETNFAWAVTALRSRGHVVAIKDGRDGSWQHAMCMVPCADMLNMAIEVWIGPFSNTSA